MANFNLDGHKLNYHPRAVADFLENRDINPIYVEVSPIANCNHHCLFCHYNYLGHKGFFRQGRMNNLIKELAAINVKSLVFAGTGEPLLHPETISAIEVARKSGIDVAMSTNGVLLKEEDLNVLANCLTWIRFSINGGNAKSYALIHQTKEEDYFKVLENIKKLKRKKDKSNASVAIGVQYILLPQNKDSVIDMAQIMRDLGVDYFVVKHFYKHSENKFEVNDSWPSDDIVKSLQISAKAMSDNKFSFIVRDKKHLFRERPYNKCYGLPFIVYIREDGEVYTCFSYQHDKNTSLGNIFEKSFLEIWNSQKKVIDYINNCIDKKKCQPNCRHHQINNYLWELRYPSIEHINFI